jgi:hypothetical protein
MIDIDPLDRLVHGADAIARILNIFKDDGTPDLRRTFYVLENGYVDADKGGRSWTSTPRRLLKPRSTPPKKQTAASVPAK